MPPFPADRRRSWRRLVQLLLWCWGLAAGQVWAGPDFISARTYWKEPCGAPVALAQLPQEAFTPYTGVLALGYRACAVWLRLRIEPAPAPAAGVYPQATVLRIRPTYLDRIELFDPLQRDAAPRVTGDRYPLAADEYRSLALHFLLAPGTAPRDVWLRVETTSTRMVDVQALSFADAVERDRREELAYAAYLALMVASLLWAFVHWLQMRGRVVGAFVVKQVLTLAWSLLLLGYGRALLGAHAAAGVVDVLTSVLVVSFTSASAYFDYCLLREYRPPRAGMRVLLALVAMLPLQLALMVAGQAPLALGLNAAVACVATFLTVALLAMARPDADNPPVLSRRLLLGFYGVISVPVGLTMLVLLGLLPGLRLALYAMFVHGLLTGVVMLVLLGVRARRLSQRHAEAMTELVLARQVVQQERVHREDQERLVGMLTHELRTPLAVVRMLLGTGTRPSPLQVEQIRQALADMNDVIERCVQAGQLDSLRLSAQWSPCDIEAELRALAQNWAGGQRLDLALPAGRLTTVRSDPQLLRIVIANLMDNACKYSPPDSTVVARLQALSQDGRPGVALAIDNLPGPAGWPDAARVFDKYYRSPHAHRQTGSGLGLYLVAGLVQLLQARIVYEPTATHIRFRLWLPA